MWPGIALGWFTKTVVSCHLKPRLVNWLPRCCVSSSPLVFSLPSSSLWPAVLGQTRLPSSWNVSPTRCWEELLGAYGLIPPTHSLFSCSHSLFSSLKLFSLLPFCLTISYLLIHFMPIYHSSIVFHLSSLHMSSWLFEVVFVCAELY